MKVNSPLIYLCSVVDEGLKFLERQFFIQKGNEKLEAEMNGVSKKE